MCASTGAIGDASKPMSSISCKRSRIVSCAIKSDWLAAPYLGKLFRRPERRIVFDHGPFGTRTQPENSQGEVAHSGCGDNSQQSDLDGEDAGLWLEPSLHRGDACTAGHTCTLRANNQHPWDSHPRSSSRAFSPPTLSVTDCVSSTPLLDPKPTTSRSSFSDESESMSRGTVGGRNAEPARKLRSENSEREGVTPSCSDSALGRAKSRKSGMTPCEQYPETTMRCKSRLFGRAGSPGPTQGFAFVSRLVVRRRRPDPLPRQWKLPTNLAETLVQFSCMSRGRLLQPEALEQALRARQVAAAGSPRSS